MKRSLQTILSIYNIPANVADAAIAKQADYWPCGSTNRGTISKRVS
jgi:hypothetical protein